MAVAATGVASLAGASVTPASTKTTSRIATTAAVPTTSLGAVARDVAYLATLVAFLPAAGATKAAGSSTEAAAAAAAAASTSALVGAVAGDVTSLATAITGFFFGRLGTLAAHVSLAATVVARWGSAFRAVSCLVRIVAALKKI